MIGTLVQTKPNYHKMYLNLVAFLIAQESCRFLQKKKVVEEKLTRAAET